MILTSLAVYPIKSCGGIALDASVVTRRGLDADRLWMVVDERGRFITQREERGLAAVATRLDGDAIVVSAPGATKLAVPRRADGARMEVEVWRHRGPAVRHQVGSAWFAALLDRPVSLVYMPEDVERRVNPAYGRAGDVVSFADGYPVHLVTEASRADVEALAGEPLAMARFRPNLVVHGASGPYDEDAWRRVAVGSTVLRVVKRCSRCVITTIDPATGAVGREPLRALADHRADAGSVYFGVYLVPDDPGAVVRVGDPVEVLERGAGVLPG